MIWNHYELNNQNSSLQPNFHRKMYCHTHTAELVGELFLRVLDLPAAYDDYFPHIPEIPFPFDVGNWNHEAVYIQMLFSFKALMPIYVLRSVHNALLFRYPACCAKFLFSCNES